MHLSASDYSHRFLANIANSAALVQLFTSEIQREMLFSLFSTLQIWSRPTDGLTAPGQNLILCNYNYTV